MNSYLKYMLAIWNYILNCITCKILIDIIGPRDHIYRRMRPLLGKSWKTPVLNDG
jgi:hypothetical protein